MFVFFYDKYYLFLLSETTVNAKNFFYDEDTEMMIFIFPQTLKVSNIL